MIARSAPLSLLLGVALLSCSESTTPPIENDPAERLDWIVPMREAAESTWRYTSADGDPYPLFYSIPSFSESILISSHESTTPAPVYLNDLFIRTMLCTWSGPIDQGRVILWDTVSNKIALGYVREEDVSFNPEIGFYPLKAHIFSTGISAEAPQVGETTIGYSQDEDRYYTWEVFTMGEPIQDARGVEHHCYRLECSAGDTTYSEYYALGIGRIRSTAWFDDQSLGDWRLDSFSFVLSDD